MVALGKLVSINQMRAFDAMEQAIFARFMELVMVTLENKAGENEAQSRGSAVLLHVKGYSHLSSTQYVLTEGSAVEER